MTCWVKTIPLGEGLLRIDVGVDDSLLIGDGLAEHGAIRRYDHRAAWDFLVHLRDIGRETAAGWLKLNGRRIGVESTMDIERYL